MSAELITSENLSKELLKSVLDDAYMQASYDSDGDIVVTDGINCIVLPSKDKSRVLLTCQFGFDPEASELLKLQAVNRINSEYVLVRAFVLEENHLRFSYDIPINGGITKKAFVLAVKRFCGIPRDAVKEHADDITV